MSGGIFVNKPFAFNIKCIIFGIAMIFFYWFASKSNNTNYWLFPLIFIIAYIIIAWYDELYNCDDRLRSGTYGPISVVDSVFKPQLRRVDMNLVDSAPSQEALYKRNVYLFHALFAMPLFMYLTYGKGGLYAVGFGLATLGFVYHIFRLYEHLMII